MKVGQLVVVQTEQVQEGDVKISNRMDTFYGLGTEFVSRPDDCTAFHATTCQQHSHGVVVVSASQGVHTTAFVVVRSSAEFTGPDNQGILEQTTAFEIFDEGGHRLVDATNA